MAKYKLKTRKSISKRIKLRIKKVGGKTVVKAQIRSAGQDHFNAKQSGKTKRNKRRDNIMSKGHNKTIKKALPHAK